MKVKVVSYSLTGNNDSLANHIATALAAEHICITETGKRTTGTIFFDILFNRTPHVSPPADSIKNDDFVIFVGPVWMGRVATTLRTYLTQLKRMSCRYAFVSICGGGEGPNPKIADELTRLTGRAPAALVEMHIADLMPHGPKPQRKDTMAYRVSEWDAANMSFKTAPILREAIAKPAPPVIIQPVKAPPAISTTQKALLVSGIVSSLYYVALNIIVPMFYQGYNSSELTVSELSAIGAPTRALWVWSSTLYTLLVIAFAWGVWHSAVGNRPLRIAGGLLLAYASIGLFWPFAPMHMREVLAAGGGTFSDTMHKTLAAVSVLFMLSVIGFGAAAYGKRFRIYSIVTLLIHVVFGALTFMDAPNMEKNLPTPYIGLWERINIGVFLLWVIVLAGVLLQTVAVAKTQAKHARPSHTRLAH